MGHTGKAYLNKDLSEAEAKIKKLQYEIRKRDSVISGLRESRDKILRSAIKMLEVMGWNLEEDLDHSSEVTGKSNLWD